MKISSNDPTSGAQLGGTSGVIAGAAAVAAVDEHVHDTSDAHTAVGVGIVDGTGIRYWPMLALVSGNDTTGNYYESPDVEGALAEIGAAIGLDGTPVRYWPMLGLVSGLGPGTMPHLSDPTDAHDASAISVLDAGNNYTGTDLETILAEIAANADTSLVTVAASGATETIDVSVARTYDVTLTANCTLTLTGAVTAEAWYVTLLLRQDGTGSRTVTWPGSVVWPGGITPVLATAANAVDIFTLFTLDGGTVWFGFEAGGGGSLTIKDEGTPLTTDATSLDFVGAGVTATGAGVAKTVTIPGATTAEIQAASPPHVHVAYETHTSDGATVTFTLDQTYEPGSVMAWNRSAGTLLGVTEVAPDQATISAAGTAGNLLDFHYAASLI